MPSRASDGGAAADKLNKSACNIRLRNVPQPIEHGAVMSTCESFGEMDFIQHHTMQVLPQGSHNVRIKHSILETVNAGNQYLGCFSVVPRIMRAAAS